MTTDLVKLLNEHRIRDGVLRDFARQFPRNDRATLDAVHDARSRCVAKIAALDEVKVLIESGEI